MSVAYSHNSVRQHTYIYIYYNSHNKRIPNFNEINTYTLGRPPPIISPKDTMDKDTDRVNKALERVAVEARLVPVKSYSLMDNDYKSDEKNSVSNSDHKYQEKDDKEGGGKVVRCSTLGNVEGIVIIQTEVRLKKS